MKMQAETGSQKQGEKLIDIERVFEEKNPRLNKFLPGFIFRYLDRKSVV